MANEEQANFELGDLWALSVEAKRRLTENHTDKDRVRRSFAPFLGGNKHFEEEEIGPAELVSYFEHDVKAEGVYDLYELQEFDLSEGESIKAYVCTQRCVIEKDPVPQERYLNEEMAECLLICYLADYLARDDALL